MSASPPPIAGVAMIAAERRLIEQLRAAHATVPERAIRLEEMRRVPKLRLARLARAGAIREVGEGRFYLDEPTYAEHRERRRRMAFIAVIAGLLAALAVYLISPS